MITLNQLKLGKYKRLSKYHKCRTPALRGCPQKRGVVLNVVIITPKKPNSARRHIAKIRLSTGRRTRASIPGEFSSKNKPIKQYSKILVRGGRIRDIIGLRYRIILGQLDASPFLKRRTSRSKYGVKLSDI